jgi:adenosylmethionine-8-amino-7-oxononanoate aminotransferase
MTAFTMPSNVFYRKYDHALPTIVRGDGIYLYDGAGKRYLDACGGAMVCSIGHGVAEVADALADQARTIAYVNGTAFTNEPVEALAALLVSKAPAGLDRVYFLNSGSEAVEAALKLARQYHVERGEPERRVVIAQTPGYHGNTLFALSASARAHYRTMFGPWLTDVVMIDAPYPYRSANREPATGAALERAIAHAGPGNVAAFIAEPIGGSSTGASVPPPGYFANVREICDRYGVIFICDEVLTGAGRTGTFFGIEHSRNTDGTAVIPDIITMGKGLNAGYAPLSAFIAKASIVEAITDGSGNFMHAQTYSHNPLAAAAALAVQRHIEKHALVERAARVGAALGERLASLQATIASPVAELIGDVRGIGMLWAMEFVRDRESREALPRNLKFAETLVEEARQHGLVLWPNVGHADGTNGDLVMIAPAFSIEPQQIDELVDLLQASLIATHGRVFEGEQ